MKKIIISSILVILVVVVSTLTSASLVSARAAGVQAMTVAQRTGLAGYPTVVGTMKGTIKRLNKEKKFGFIAGEDGNEYFFHASALNGVTIDDLIEGQWVTFERGVGSKARRAENVRPA